MSSYLCAHIFLPIEHEEGKGITNQSRHLAKITHVSKWRRRDGDEDLNHRPNYPRVPANCVRVAAHGQKISLAKYH